MKKVLIITEVFPPAFNPRMGYLVKYLPELGWGADIITINTIKDNNFKALIGHNNIVRVNLRNLDIPHGLIQKIWHFLNLWKYFINNKKPFIKGIESNFIKEDYSLILVSVSWELFVLDAGLTLSRKWELPLIVDLRDIHEQKPYIEEPNENLKDYILNYLTRSFENKKIQLRNKILTNASAVTTVSPFHVEQLLKFNRNVSLIYNGYDSDLFYPKYGEKSNTFSITYTGLVLDEVDQDPNLLFEAVIQLGKDQIIDNKSFRIQFYTPINFRLPIIKNRLFPLVKKYIDFYDYIDFHEVPLLLQKSSIALVLSNISNNKGPKGILTTKLFEYMGAERPVLCVRSDEDIIENAIIQANVGISARTVNDAHDFILEKWNEWKEKGFTTVKVNQEFKQQFSRKVQTREFIDLFSKTII